MPTAVRWRATSPTDIELARSAEATRLVEPRAGRATRAGAGHAELEPSARRRAASTAGPLEPATFRSRLGKARGLLSGYLGAVRSKGKIDADTWDDLEEALIRADVGVGATDALLDALRSRVKAEEITGPTRWSTR